MMVNLDLANTTETLKEVFDMWDINKDNKISMDELKEILGDSKNNDFLKIMAEVDTSGDNAIDFDEFCKMMQKSHQMELPKK